MPTALAPSDSALRPALAARPICYRAFRPCGASLASPSFRPTTASADFSCIVSPCCHGDSPVARTTRETSQGKTRLFPASLAGFTCTRFRMTFGHPHPLLGYPTVPAFYPVSVRRVRASPTASFRFHLAADTLAFGLWFRSLRSTEDLHLQESTPCLAHKKASQWPAFLFTAPNF